MEFPRDITACEQTSQVYVAGWQQSTIYIWKVSVDGSDIKQWLSLPDSFRLSPLTTLSVTSSRLLVTSNKELIQFDATGSELRHVYVHKLIHAVESPAEILIVVYNTQMKQNQVCIVNAAGQVVKVARKQGGSLVSLNTIPHIAVDSKGNVIVADCENRRILLLDSQLVYRHIILNESQLKYEQPERLCYLEQSRQLLVLSLIHI